jgi:glycosyltransferase involved in cell wall biosynthesis
MRIVIATVKVPFMRGGAELHASSLQRALVRAGHDVEIVEIPFRWYPPEKVLDHLLACRLLDLTESNGVTIDLLIGLKFPAFHIEHPNKVLWILHQHRQAYDLWDHPEAGDLRLQPMGAEVRQAVEDADRNLLPRARKIFANSRNVADRLHRYCGISAEPLYHPPPNAEMFHSGPAQDYVFFPSRIGRLKRQALVVQALSHATDRVQIRFAGVPESIAEFDQIKRMSERSGVSHRVKWLGSISEEEKVAQYAGAIGVVYPPVDEDYGYVTLEAMLSSKPVITCTDSGGPVEFVLHGHTGLVVDPTPESLGAGLNSLFGDVMSARKMGVAARARYDECHISWDHVVQALVG